MKDYYSTISKPGILKTSAVFMILKVSRLNVTYLYVKQAFQYTQGFPNFSRFDAMLSSFQILL